VQIRTNYLKDMLTYMYPRIDGVDDATLGSIGHTIATAEKSLHSMDDKRPAKDYVALLD